MPPDTPQPLRELINLCWAQNYRDRPTAQEILTKHLSEEDLRQLAASCGTLPIKVEDRSPFYNSVLCHMVFAFVLSGDRNSLVTLLATRCPDRVSLYFEIEYLLAGSERRKKLKYPIFIF